MSFGSRTNYFQGHFTTPSFKITSSTQNKSSSTAEARNEKGDVVAQQTYGLLTAPSCTYVLAQNSTIANLAMGQPLTYGGNSYVYTSVKIDTAAGTPPQITVTGEQVTTSPLHTDCYYNVTGMNTIKFCHHAQDVFGASTYSSGCNMISCSTTIQCSLTKATKDGETVTWDVIDGKIIVEYTLQSNVSSGWSDPTITYDNDVWTMTSPVTISEPDSDFPTWTYTLEKPLVHAG